MTLFTYPEFVFFCEAFQRLNHFDFDPVDIVAELKEDQTHYTYEGMYRDESNYKSHVELTYDGEDVRWNIAMGWEDADGELCALYDAMLILKGGEGSASRVQALLSGSRYDGLSVLQALTSDERGAHLLGVTVKRGERVQGIQLLACHVSSCELELLRFMIQLEQGGAAASEWMSYTPGDTLALPEAVRICGNQLDGASRRWFLLYVSDSQQYVLLRQGLN